VLDAEAAVSVVLNAAVMFDAVDAGNAEVRRLLRLVTPLAKAWITARARVVASEAMNVRGGNGYVEDWVNARLLRDAYLGAIWEGSTNVVALDVQRAIVKDGCLVPFAAFVGARLDGAHERAAKPAADLVRAALVDVQQRAAGWPRLEQGDRELDARAAAETLYHVLATALLLDEGQTLVRQRGDFRKLFVATLYARRWLAGTTAGATPFSWRTLAQLERVVDWQPVAADALAADPAGRC
jgi:acyl-CoA dehydrogenase-like protein